MRALDSALVTIGSHSHTHPQLSQLGGEHLTRELTLSENLLQEWIQRPVRHFAFPSGGYTNQTMQAVRDAGYASAWTTEARCRTGVDNHYRMPRIPIDDRAPISVLAAKMTADSRRLRIGI